MLALEKFLFDHLAGTIGCELFFFGDNGWAFDLIHDNGYKELDPKTYLNEHYRYRDYLSLTPGYESKTCSVCKHEDDLCQCEKK
jgi:hypothetical protein